MSCDVQRRSEDNGLNVSLAAHIGHLAPGRRPSDFGSRRSGGEALGRAPLVCRARRRHWRGGREGPYPAPLQRRIPVTGFGTFVMGSEERPGLLATGRVALGLPLSHSLEAARGARVFGRVARLPDRVSLDDRRPEGPHSVKDASLPRPRLALVASAPEPEDEAQLVAELALGDLAALARSYNRWHQRVRTFARRLLSDEAAAEDVVQEVFGALPRAASRFRGSVSAGDVPAGHCSQAGAQASAGGTCDGAGRSLASPTRNRLAPATRNTTPIAASSGSG